jgi:hypothetical membrane protein
MHSRITIFTDTYPLLGPLIYVLCVQYLLVQLIAAAAWPGGYSWRINLISDLGNTVCGPYSGRLVCSPEHALVNASFIMLGTTMAIGSLLIYQEFKESRGSLLGFSLMGLAGLGTVFVGLFPENTVLALHASGAVLGLFVGNVSLMILALAIRQARNGFRLYTFLSGFGSVLAFGLFTLGINFGLGQGGMERLVSYPQTIWLTLFGLYMSATRIRARMNRPTSVHD